VVGAVERIGHAEQGRKAADPAALTVAEAGVGFVPHGGQTAPVVTGDLGNEIDFLFVQMAPSVFADEFGGMLVVGLARGRSGPANVVKQGGAEEKHAVAGLEGVDAFEQIEKTSGEAADLGDVAGFRLQFLHQAAGFADGGIGQVKFHGGCG
jgi:hypothetical protein